MKELTGVTYLHHILTDGREPHSFARNFAALALMVAWLAVIVIVAILHNGGTL